MFALTWVVPIIGTARREVWNERPHILHIFCKQAGGWFGDQPPAESKKLAWPCHGAGLAITMTRWVLSV